MCIVSRADAAHLNSSAEQRTVSSFHSRIPHAICNSCYPRQILITTLCFRCQYFLHIDFFLRNIAPTNHRGLNRFNRDIKIRGTIWCERKISNFLFAPMRICQSPKSLKSHSFVPTPPFIDVEPYPLLRTCHHFHPQQQTLSLFLVFLLEFPAPDHNIRLG